MNYTGRFRKVHAGRYLSPGRQFGAYSISSTVPLSAPTTFRHAMAFAEVHYSGNPWSAAGKAAIELLLSHSLPYFSP